MYFDTEAFTVSISRLILIMILPFEINKPLNTTSPLLQHI